MNKKTHSSLRVKKQKAKLFAFCFLLFAIYHKAQVNYVINGGFEQLDSCTYYMKDPFYNPYIPIYYSSPWDTLKSGTGAALCYVMNRCMNPNNSTGVPANLSGGGYQQPHNGNGYSYNIYLKRTPNPSVNWRNYMQQKLLQKLINGKSYCVTYWASLVNYANYGIDELSAYFDDGSLQLISPGHEAIANPQVKSPTGVFYSDTLNWMKVQGTFVANGTEEYITLGNFRYTSATTFTALDGNTTAGIALYFIDDVSVIERDLPAYAGADTYLIPGDSVFIGRPSEIGLDDDCFWYKLPNTTTPIDTVAGLWVKPVTTTTYVVKQDICGTIKWDTVVVDQSAVGIKEHSYAATNTKLYPNPNNGEFVIDFNNLKDDRQVEVFVYDIMGKVVYNETKTVTEGKLSLKPNLFSGTYLIKVKLPDGTFNIHRLIIEK